jgi:hypothetical protein
MEIQLDEKTNNALLWITGILNKHKIPFQISGGFAAKLYGSPRPLNDIDIDIPEDRFEEIHDEVKNYYTMPPQQYVDKKWNLWLMTLNYEGQEIDVGGGINLKIHDDKNDVWLPFSVDFGQVVWISVAGITVPVIPKEELVRYKSYLDGAHQQIDIDAIQGL